MTIRLDYIDRPSPNIAGLLRLYGFDRTDARRLWSLFRLLRRQRVLGIQLDEQPFVQSQSSCRLRCNVSCSPRADSVTGSAATGFVWSLSPDDWRDAASLTVPMLDPRPGTYQWLPVRCSAVRVLLSPTGEW